MTVPNYKEDVCMKDEDFEALYAQAEEMDKDDKIGVIVHYRGFRSHPIKYYLGLLTEIGKDVLKMKACYRENNNFRWESKTFGTGEISWVEFLSAKKMIEMVVEADTNIKCAQSFIANLPVYIPVPR